MALSLGLAFGPVLGSLAYTAFGSYVNTFYFFTVYIAVIGSICVSFVPDRINNKPGASSDGTVEENPYAKTITYGTILKNRRSLSSILMCVYGMTAS